MLIERKTRVANIVQTLPPPMLHRPRRSRKWRQNCSPNAAWSEQVPDFWCTFVLWQCLMSLDGDGEGKVDALSFEPYGGGKPIEQHSWRNES